MEKEIILAIDIGGTSVKMGAVKEDVLLEKSSYRNIWNGNQDKLVEDLKPYIDSYINKYKINKIGIGCPGEIEDGVVLFASNLGWRNFDIKKSFNDKYPNLEINVNNDGIAAVNAELKYGILKNVKNAIFIVFGRGVGGAIIIDGKIYEGERKNGGKIGHLTYKKPNGRKCNCGRVGCYETYTSVTGLIQTIKEEYYQQSERKEKLKRLSGFQIVQYVKEKNPVVCKGVQLWNEDISEEILDLVEIFDPSHIVLAGGITESGLLDLEVIRNKLKTFGYDYVNVSISRFKGKTGLIGAASAFNK